MNTSTLKDVYNEIRIRNLILLILKKSKYIT